MLNPSEALNVQEAERFANEKGLQGLAQSTLVNWARRAEQNQRWTEDETVDLYHNAGMRCMECVQKVGPGFGRFSWGVVENAV